MSHLLPSKKELKQLAKFNEPYCLSIYAPYIDSTGSTNPNKIVLKNLMRQARTDLSVAGLKANLVEKTLRPIQALLEGQEFWPVRRESLVIFAHNKIFKYFRIPGRDIPRMLSIEKGFVVDPLKKLTAENKSYIVLTLGHNNVQLYEANSYDIRPIQLRGFPADMLKTLHIDEFPRVVETHPVGPAARGRASQAFHSQYNVSQTDKTMLLQFFRHINRSLHDFLQAKQMPLVIAGVGYLLPLYQSVNTYPHLVAKGITGGLSGVGPKLLHKKASRIVSKWRDRHLPKQGTSKRPLK